MRPHARKSPGNVARDPAQPGPAIARVQARRGAIEGGSVGAGSAFGCSDVGSRQAAHQALDEIGREAAPEQEARLRRSLRHARGQGGETARANSGRILPGRGATELFIYPGFEFRVLSGIVTNFHLPQSSLLMLVCALGGLERVLNAYRAAVLERYRFYSYGDAMIIV